MAGIDFVLGEVERALEAKLHYLAVVLTLTIPDVCAALQNEKGETDRHRYVAWFDDWLATDYPLLTGLDLYRLRCGVSHQGRLGHPKMRYSRILFSLPAGMRTHNNILASGSGDALNLDAEMFCLDVVRIARAWYAAKKDDPHVVANLPHLVQYRQHGLDTHIRVGTPVIA